jgi:hypothetical protein
MCTRVAIRAALADVAQDRHEAASNGARRRTAMIARNWRGRTRAEDAERYLAYLKSTGLKGYAEVDGNRGVRTLVRIEGEIAEFLLITDWDSMEADR